MQLHNKLDGQNKYNHENNDESCFKSPISLSENKTAPKGKYPDVIPFAHVIISGTTPKTSSEEKK